MKNSTLRALILSIIFVFAILTVNAQVGSGYWSFSNPKPFGFTGNATSYIDDNNGIIVGDAGGIARTTDGGGTWSYFAFTCLNGEGKLTKPMFNDLQLVNSSLAYAVGSNGIMIKSIDGGVNWTLVTTPFFSTGLEINTVYFVDALTGYIGGAGDPITRKGSLYKTINGGATWTVEKEFPEPLVEWDPSTTIIKVRFSASGVGYVGGSSGLVWKYKDGVWTDYSITDAIIYPNVAANDTTIIPHSWDEFSDTIYTTYADNIYGLNQQNYRAIAIINDTAVVVGTQNNGGLIRINTGTPEGSYLMLNNGSTTPPKYHPLESGQIWNLACRDGITIAGANENGYMLLSNDKGFSWTKNQVYPEGSQESGLSFYGVDITPAKRFALCGAEGIIADSMSQWRRPYSTVKRTSNFFGYGIFTLGFYDANNGIAAGSGGTMLRTTDGGNSWTDITNNSFNPWDGYNSVAYLSAGTLYAAASNGTFYKSSDKGTSFDLLFSEPAVGNLSAMSFINEDTGWMAANTTYTDVDFNNTFHQIIYHTYDGGLTWDSSNTVFPITDYQHASNITDLRFLNKSIGYATGNNGSIFKSVDGGLTWAKQSNMPVSATTLTISSVNIVDENIAYVSGDSGVVMKTVNGGNAWTYCNTGLPADYVRYPKILMNNATDGMVFSDGNVYTTKDGGDSWSVFYAPVGEPLGAACFAPMSGCTIGLCKKVFAGGSFSGKLLKFDADIVIPVKFSNLTAAATSRGNQLFWTAFSQESISYFEIEGSVNGRSFQKIADEVYPSGLNQQSYKWLDADAPAGKYYYRVKAIERSGATFYTNTVMINGQKTGGWNHQLSHGTLLLTNPNVEKGDVTAQVINASGQVVAAKNWNQNGGAFNDMLQLPPSAKGIYFVKLMNAGTMNSFKVFVQ